MRRRPASKAISRAPKVTEGMKSTLSLLGQFPFQIPDLPFQIPDQLGRPLVGLGLNELSLQRVDLALDREHGELLLQPLARPLVLGVRLPNLVENLGDLGLRGLALDLARQLLDRGPGVA